MIIKSIINKFISFWSNFFPKTNQIELNRDQRIDATSYLFMKYEEVTKNSKLITQEDHDSTLCGDIDKDADAIYLLLKKYNLIDESLKAQLQSLKALEYFENLKIEDFNQ